MDGKIKIQCVNAVHSSKEIIVKAVSDTFVSYKKIKELKQNMCRKIGYDKIKLQLSCKECMEKTIKREDFWESMLMYLKDEDKAVWALLEGSKCELKDRKLVVDLDKKVATILKEKQVDNLINEHIRMLWDEHVEIDFVDCDVEIDRSDTPVVRVNFTSEDHDRAILESIKRNEEMLKQGFNGGGNADSSKPAGDSNVGNKYPRRGGRRRNSLNFGEDGSLPKDFDGNEIIFGKEINCSITAMRDVNYESGVVAVRGRVISCETRAFQNGNAMAIFYITDNTNALTVKFFFDQKDLKAVNGTIKKNLYLTVMGNAEQDRYSGELTIAAQSIVKYKPVEKVDDAPVKRVELHLHTNMSPQDAVTRPDQLIPRALKWGHKAVAITDHGVVQAYPEVYKAAKNKDIKVIYGVECYLTNQQEEMPLQSAKQFKSYHCILLVKNQVGLKNLYKLISRSHIDHFYKRPRIPKYVLDSHREGLIVGSACCDGELFSAFLNNEKEEELERIASYYDYLEIQPVGNNMFLIREGVLNSVKDIEKINTEIVKLGDKLGKMTVATGDVHFLDEEDSIYRAVMMAGQGFSDADIQPPLFFRTTNEMLDEFKYLGDKAYEVVVENTNKIADLIEDVKPVPSGFYPPVISGSDEELREKAYSRAKELYGENPPEIVKTRLDRELNSIIENGYSIMYITAQRLVAESARNGYSVGSRGSVGSSFAAFTAGITEVNSLPAHYLCMNCHYSEFHENEGLDCGYDLPEKDCPNCNTPLNREGFDIPFETFLGFDGDKVPDIDLNFSSYDQGNAHKYTEVLFGADYVFRAGTISGLAEKTARGYVLKYLQERGRRPNEAVLNWLASGFEGVKRTTGQHPGGIMVIPKDMEIYDFTPIQRPADKVASDVITTHFDYHFLHDNILKLDILGHDGPTIIRLLEDYTGVKSKEVNISDDKVLSLFNSNEALNLDKDLTKIDIQLGTFGIPEFGTGFVQNMLLDTRPNSISELVRISGLSHGTDVWIGNAKNLITEGTCTLSEAICCRDDIMLFLINKGLDKKLSFIIMEAVRKGRGLTPEQEQAMREKNVPEWYILSCKKIKYMFPKAHAVAYVILSLRIAWYKVYYPMQFYAATFSLKVDDFDASNMIYGIDKAYSKYSVIANSAKGDGQAELTAKEEGQLTLYELLFEMYARNIKFLPIDLYKSEATKFVPEGDAIRPPLCSLAGIGQAAGESIVRSREEGEFLSVEDLKIRTGITKSAIEILRQEGCLDGMPETNQLSLFDF